MWAVSSLLARSLSHTLGVTNVVGSALDRESDVALYIRAGPEIGVAATKTYLAQTMLLQLLAIQVSRYSGGVSGEAKELRFFLQGSRGGCKRNRGGRASRSRPS